MDRNRTVRMACRNPAPFNCASCQLTRSGVALTRGVRDHPRSTVVFVYEFVVRFHFCADYRNPQRNADHHQYANKVEDHLEARVDPYCAVVETR